MSLSLNTFRQFRQSGFASSQALDGGSIPLTRYRSQVVYSKSVVFVFAVNSPVAS